VATGSFPHPLRRVNTAQLSHNTPGLHGERRERGEGEGGGKGRREGKGSDPQGLVDTPMFQILKNTLRGKYAPF